MLTPTPVSLVDKQIDKVPQVDDPVVPEVDVPIELSYQSIINSSPSKRSLEPRANYLNGKSLLVQTDLTPSTTLYLRSIYGYDDNLSNLYAELSYVLPKEDPPGSQSPYMSIEPQIVDVKPPGNKYYYYKPSRDEFLATKDYIYELKAIAKNNTTSIKDHDLVDIINNSIVMTCNIYDIDNTLKVSKTFIIGIPFKLPIVNNDTSIKYNVKLTNGNWSTTLYSPGSYILLKPSNIAGLSLTSIDFKINAKKLSFYNHPDWTIYFTPNESKFPSHSSVKYYSTNINSITGWSQYSTSNVIPFTTDTMIYCWGNLETINVGETLSISMRTKDPYCAPEDKTTNNILPANKVFKIISANYSFNISKGYGSSSYWNRGYQFIGVNCYRSGTLYDRNGLSRYVQSSSNNNYTLNGNIGIGADNVNGDANYGNSYTDIRFHLNGKPGNNYDMDGDYYLLNYSGTLNNIKGHYLL